MAKISLFQNAKICNPSSGIAESTLFEVSNVVKGLAETSPLSHEMLLESPSPPPYPNLWMEWSFPSSNIALGSSQRIDTVSKLGAHVLYERTGDGWAVFPLFYFKQSHTKCFQIGTMFRLLLDAQGVVVDRTFIHLSPSGSEAKDTIWVTDQALVTRFMNDIISGENRTPPNLPRIKENNHILKAWSQASMATTAFLYYRFVTGLLHVKNIEIVDSLGYKKKSGRRRRKKGLRHYTLRIRPGNRSRRSASDSQSTGDKNSFHFARGHFKTYTEDAPLLGKHVGTYWWEAHTRGSRSRGSITKDYEVLPLIECKETAK